MDKTWEFLKGLGGVLASMFFVLIVMNAIFGSQADGTIVDADGKWDVLLINSEPDMALVVSALVKNTGDAGDIEVAASVSCSEGVFIRKQLVHLEPNQERNLSFQFHELTVNATNVDYRVSVSP